jgi:hypothetical protein
MASPQVIAAATFTIVFEGLVAFVGPSSDLKSHVVVVDEPTHHKSPSITIGADVIDLKKDDQITFVTTTDTAAPAKTTTEFDVRVPTMKDHVTTPTGDVHDGVKNPKKQTDGALAFITLPTGVLKAEGVFEHPIEFQKADGTWSEPLCAAREVRLEVQLADNEQITVRIARDNKPAVERPATPATSVHVKNTSNDDELHYQHGYGKLLKSGAIRAVREVETKVCKEEGGKVRIEPFRPPTEAVVVLAAPRSDCGPTDWP